MTIPVTDILARSSDLLQDTEHLRWPAPSLVIWLNDCLADINDKYQNATAFLLRILMTRGVGQPLPENIVNILAVYCNLETVFNDGVGRHERRTAITPINRTTLDQLLPGWGNPDVVPYTDMVENVIDNPDHSRTFQVFPGNTGNGQILVLAARILDPVEPDGEADSADGVAAYQGINIALDRRYIGAIVNYVVSRAWESDVDVPGAAVRAANAMQHYRISMQTSEQIDTVRTMADAPTIAVSPEGSG